MQDYSEHTEQQLRGNLERLQWKIDELEEAKQLLEEEMDQIEGAIDDLEIDEEY